VGQWFDLLSSDEIKSVASILMDAAHADGTVSRNEAREVRTVLEELFGEKHLPDFLVDHLLTFDPEKFNLAATCAGLHLRTAEERRGLLLLVGRVVDADSTFDLAESVYVRHLAQEIGASKDEYRDLVVELLE
jgi:uncharacterized tellurite resistance protein B-like protein